MKGEIKKLMKIIQTKFDQLGLEKIEYEWRGARVCLYKYTLVIGLRALNKEENLRLLQSLATFLSKRLAEREKQEQGTGGGANPPPSDEDEDSPQTPSPSDEDEEAGAEPDSSGGDSGSSSSKEDEEQGQNSSSEGLDSDSCFESSKMDEDEQGQNSSLEELGSDSCSDSGKDDDQNSEEPDLGTKQAGSGIPDNPASQGHESDDSVTNYKDAGCSSPHSDSPIDSPGVDGKDRDGRPLKEKEEQAPGADSSGVYSFFEKICSPDFTPQYGGGGKQLDIEEGVGIVKPSPRIKEAILQLASGEDWSQKEDGFLFYDGRKLVKKIASYQYHTLQEAKYKRPADKVWFFVDTSGSVAGFSEFIISMILSCRVSDRIMVFSGSEAHPEKFENKGEYVLDYQKSFYENMLMFVKKFNPEVGSQFVFWGDLCDIYIRGDEKKLKKLLQPYQLVWLHCDTERNITYAGCEFKEASSVGFRMFRNIDDEQRLISALKSIRR